MGKRVAAMAAAVTMAWSAGSNAADLGIGGGDRIAGADFASRSPVVARNGMAATAHPLATQAAIDILKAGGSAADAAIAANAVLGLVEPVGCGIGGDLFALIWDPGANKLHALNASGRAPQGRSLAQLREKLAAMGRTELPRFGSLTVTVPGAVSGWVAMHDKFGKLPLDQALAPAVRYAREGAPVAQTIAYYWDRNMKGLARAAEVEEFENAKATYLVDGRAPRAGELFRNPDLAATYEAIGRTKGAAFYTGEIAQTIDVYMRRIGGDLRAADLAAHTAEWVEPLAVNYRGYDVWAMPPNTQGFATLQILKMAEGFDLKAMGPGSADAAHVMIEAKRLAFEDLAKYAGDPAFVKPPLAKLLSDAYLAQRRALIRLDRANPDVAAGELPFSQDTTYLAVADKDGMMVSLIQSNFRGMGSGLAPDGLGFMLQNRGEGFSMREGDASVYAPGKRPYHTIIPGFVTKDGKPWLAYGVMGGDMQPQGHAQVLVNLIDFGMNVQEAGDAARWHHGGSTHWTGERENPLGEVALESGFSAETRAELARRGHTVKDGDGQFGGYQAILRDPVTGVYQGASEMRKDGQAGGY